jgi:aminodeoxyfutalosine synthase
VEEIQRLIRETGREPVERDTLYRRVVRGDGDPQDWEVAEPILAAHSGA